jgi:hypothetical protein
MVDVRIEGSSVVFEPRGLHKFWTLRWRVEVPRSAIRLARRAPAGVTDGWKGWRLPGTHIPGLLVAGSYRLDGEWHFWDVRGRGHRAVEVLLSGTRYSRIVVDVDDPDAAVRRLTMR